MLKELMLTPQICCYQNLYNFVTQLIRMLCHGWGGIDRKCITFSVSSLSVVMLEPRTSIERAIVTPDAPRRPGSVERESFLHHLLLTRV